MSSAEKSITDQKIIELGILIAVRRAGEDYKEDAKVFLNPETNPFKSPHQCAAYKGERMNIIKGIRVKL